MNVLSLFDGMSCGQIALNMIGVKPTNYYASEIDKYAITVTQANYPNTIQMGDVTKWREWEIEWGSIDLLIGGSPCQGFSFAGKQLAFDDPRSKLFFVFVDILNHIRSLNPDVKFLLENVKMKKEYSDVISEHLGVEPVFINSALVSAQNRQRYYWANFEVTQPEDKNILLKDIIEDLPLNESMPDNVEFKQNYAQWDLNNKGNKSQDQRAFYINGKHGTLPAHGGRSKVKVCLGQAFADRDKSYCIDANYHKGGNPEQYFNKSRRQLAFSNAELTNFRKLTPLECERLQTVPDNYTAHVSNTQRYKMLGNGWTVDVIAHILRAIKEVTEK